MEKTAHATMIGVNLRTVTVKQSLEDVTNGAKLIHPSG